MNQEWALDSINQLFDWFIMCWNFGRIPPISWLDDQGSQGVWNWTEVLPFTKFPLGCAPWYWITINLGSTATNINSGLIEFMHRGRGENIELYNSEVKSWRVGIARCCSRLWPPEARPDNFFTRPTCNGSKRPSALLSIENDQVQFRRMWTNFLGFRCKIGCVQ